MVAHKYALSTKGLQAIWRKKWYNVTISSLNSDGSYEVKWPGVKNTAPKGSPPSNESTYTDVHLRIKGQRGPLSPRKASPKKAPKKAPKKSPKKSPKAAPKPRAAALTTARVTSRKPSAKPAVTPQAKPKARAASSAGLTRRPSTEVVDMKAGIRQLVSTEKKLELVLLCDGSGSMGSNFEKVRAACKKVITAFQTRNPVIGIVQFGTTSKTECDVTDDYDKVLETADSMKYMCAPGTHPLPAFKEAAKLFQPGTRGKPILFFFTDGGSVGDDVIKLSQEMQNKKITVVAVGVGVDMSLLKKVSSPNQAYYLNNFSELMQVFDDNY